MALFDELAQGLVDGEPNEAFIEITLIKFLLVQEPLSVLNRHGLQCQFLAVAE